MKRASAVSAATVALVLGVAAAPWLAHTTQAEDKSFSPVQKQEIVPPIIGPGS